MIGAHSADFVWRAGGAIAVATSNGGAACVLALSYGERGESGELWKEQGQTVERVKEIRHGEAERAASALGAQFECLDLGDYPLEIDGDALVSIADRIRAFAPDVVLTHTDRDPFNPDHATAFFAVEKARALAAGAGVPSAFETVEPPELLLFEPHQPELGNFVPTTFVDITPVIEQKNAAMEEMKAQSYLHTYYSQRAEQRGNHATLLGECRDLVRGGVPARDTPSRQRAVTDAFGVGPARDGNRSRGRRARGRRRRAADPDRARLTRRRACADRALQPERQPHGARGRRGGAARRGPRADHAGTSPVALVGDLLATQAKAVAWRRSSWMEPSAISTSCVSSGSRSGRATSVRGRRKAPARSGGRGRRCDDPSG